MNELRVSATTHNPVAEGKNSIQQTKKLNIKSVSNDDQILESYSSNSMIQENKRVRDKSGEV